MPILDFNNKKEVEEYQNFVLNHKGSSFMQDLNWGKVKNNWKHEAIYLKENGNIIATMMILIQKLPHTNVSLMYAPRGPVCDIYDIDLVNKLIKDMTLEEIKQLRLQDGEESIMTLPEFLDLVHDQVGVLIEFKNSQGGKLEKYAWPILEKYNGRWVMQAFQPDSLKWFKQNQPSIPRGQLCFNYMGTKNPWLRKFLYTYLFSNFIGRPNFISYNWPGCKYKTIKLLRKMHAPLLVWTVQNEEVYNQVKDKCDNVIFENLELK